MRRLLPRRQARSVASGAWPANPALNRSRRPRRSNPRRKSAPRGPSKIDSVIALLSREQGATLTELVEATGWLPHTTRAALTGLRKKGHSIAKTKRGDVTCYRIEETA